LSKNNSTDLSDGGLNEQDAKQTNLGLQEQLHRRSMQQTAFSAGLSFAAVLFMVAVFFGGCLLMQLSRHPSMHWHASVLVAAFVIPPTVIFMSVLRAVYKRDGDRPEDVDLPVADLAKNIVNQLFDLLKKDNKG